MQKRNTLLTILVLVAVLSTASHAVAQCRGEVQFIVEELEGQLLIDPGNDIFGEEVTLPISTPGSYHLEFPPNAPPNAAQVTLDLTIRDDGVMSGVARNRPTCLPEPPQCFGERMTGFLNARAVRPPSFTWAEPAGGAFNVPDHWNPDCDFPQLASDTARFVQLVDQQGITIDSVAVSANGATAGRFIVDRVTLDLDGTASVSNNSIVEPSLSIIDGGTLRLDNGARLTAVHGSVGFTPATGAPGQAELQILGTGANTTFSGRLIVGEFADGSLAVQDGATLDCAEAIVGDIAVGQASLRGAGSRWDADSLTIGAVSAAGTVEVRESARVEIIDKLTVGDLSTGILRIIDGGQVGAAEVELGKQGSGVSRGNGTVELRLENGGAAPQLTVNGPLRVGVGGDGRLSLADGATVVAQKLEFAPSPTTLVVGGTSEVIVQGAASNGSPSDLTVTDPVRLSNGALEVLDGAFANFSDLTLGDGGDTFVSVRGFRDPSDSTTAATLSATGLNVGQSGPGALEVETGGKVVCSELTVGSVATNGVGRIRVPGGQIAVAGELKVRGDSLAGQSQEGAIEITAGGALEATGLRLGDEATSDQAEIVVRDGAPPALSHLVITKGNFPNFTAEAFIGVAGPGVLRLENNATVTVLGSAKVGGSPLGGEGLLEIGAESDVAISGNLDVGGASPGTIRLLANSSFLGAGGGTVINAGGRVEGIGTFEGPRFVNPGGFVSPGLSAGTLTIDGDYEQPEGGVLVIEVGGVEAGQFDVLHVTGNAILAGTVDLRFIDGFMPKPGDNVDFVKVDGTITGKLTGGTLIDAPGDPEAGQPAAQAEVKWEVTPEGTCRLTVTDVRAATDSASAIPGCGPGLCGAGVVPPLSLTLVGMKTMRRTRRLRRN